MAQVFSAEKYTSTSKKLQFYSDFNVNLDIHPGKKDLNRVLDEDAVKRAVRNLILTNTGERVFQPAIGSNLSRQLFELADNDTLDLAEDLVGSTLRLFEPRVRLISVIANVMPDMNTMNLTIVFSILNTSNTTTLDIVLYRAR